MSSLTARLVAVAAVGLAALAPAARAEMINFTYSWEVLPSNSFPGGTGSVTLTPSATALVPGHGGATLGGGPTFIPGAEVRTDSTATSPPDSFDTPFHMKLTITDDLTHESADITFTGTIKGTLTSDNSTLTSTFDNPVTQSRTLGGHVFSVTIAPTLSNLPSPISNAPAMIDARVQISNPSTPDPDPQPADAPEPCSLLLGATAIAGLVARRWWAMKGA